MQQKMYAIRDKKTKEFYTFSVTSNGDADFCNAYSVSRHKPFIKE